MYLGVAEKRMAKEKLIFLLKSSGYSNKLAVLKNTPLVTAFIVSGVHFFCIFFHK